MHSVGGRPVVVTEFVEVRPNFRDGLTREQLLESFDLPFAEEVDEALARALAGADAAGPLGSDVSALVRRNDPRIKEWREAIAVCQERCRASPGELVLTHGEPDPPNVIITPAGELLPLDWGDLLRAPPERDALALRSLGIAPRSRPDVLRFYELRWILSELAEYVARFTNPHQGNAEDLEKRRELARDLA